MSIELWILRQVLTSPQAIKGIPTCYIFSCPEGNPASPKPPFHALVPQGNSREPGLILVSATGQIRFWDSIGIGLAGGDNFVSSQVDGINYEEEVTNLIRVDVSVSIVSTWNPASLLQGPNIYPIDVVWHTLPHYSYFSGWQISPCY